MANCARHTRSAVRRRGLFFGTTALIALMSHTATLAQVKQTALTTNYSGVTSSATATAAANGLASREFALFQNNPNPCNPSTKIQYNLGNSAKVSLRVYNLLGNEVATLVDGPEDAGTHNVTFDTNKGPLSLASGVYFYRLEAGSFVSTRKMAIMK